jgi:hypothetical protein
MKHLTRVAAVAATTALAAAGLVGTATTSANAAKAAPLATTYSCSTPLGDLELPVTLSTTLPTSAKANKTIPAKTVTIGVTVGADLVGAASGLLGATGLGGSVAGDILAGKTKVGMTGTMPTTDIVDPFAALEMAGTGKTKAFKLAKAGTYVVKAPKTITFTPTNQDGEPLIGPMPCTLANGAPSKLGSIKVK